LQKLSGQAYFFLAHRVQDSIFIAGKNSLTHTINLQESGGLIDPLEAQDVKCRDLKIYQGGSILPIPAVNLQAA